MLALSYHAVHMNADESVHFELEDYLMGLLLMCNELVSTVESEWCT